MIAPVEARSYQPHPLHASERSWPETNCYTDLWIELLHALGCDPLAGMAFLLSVDFDGEQWEFFKYPPEDLRKVYGISVNEINVWRPVIDHVETHLALGRLLTVEVDAYYLPDTIGTSYHTTHTKTTIVVNRMDREAERAEYFHGPGLHEVGPDDFRRLLRLDLSSQEVLVPYAETVNVDHILRRADAEVVECTVGLVRDNLARRPSTNPVARLGERVAADVAWLRDEGVQVFHGYAFATLRQLGAWASATSEFVWWLTKHDDRPDRDATSLLEEAANRLAMLAEGAKSTQFRLARAAAGKLVDLTTNFDEMAAHWHAAFDHLVMVYLTDGTADG